jgi:hypothetical protein
MALPHDPAAKAVLLNPPLVSPRCWHHGDATGFTVVEVAVVSVALGALLGLGVTMAVLAAPAMPLVGGGILL